MYCNYCGCENPDNSNFCSECGQSLKTNAQKEECVKKAQYTLTLFRESQLYIINPPVNVEVNGEVFGSIANGERINISLPEGEHEINFLMSMRKKRITVDLNKDTTIILKWNRISGNIEAVLR